MVFNGESAPYAETDPTYPMSPYGKAKAEAEEAVCKLYPQAVIVRSSLIYGIDPPDHQTRWLLEKSRGLESVKLFTDEVRSPIWVTTLCRVLLELTATSHTGLLHVGSPVPVN